MSFYLSAVDDLLRDPAVDQPILGLILCRDKNRLIAAYALRDSLPTIEELEAELSREPAPAKPPKRRRHTDA